MSSRASDEMFRAALGEPSVDASVSFSSSSALLGGGSPTLLAKGAVYRFVATETCHIDFNAASGSATATTSSFLVPPLTPVFLTMTANLYCAVIRNSTDGLLQVSKMQAAGLL
jgi:hypothetical protein